MSNFTSRHDPIACNTIDPEPTPLSGREMALIVAYSLPAFVLAFHLVALASGGAW